jgi:heme exporter protein C
MRDHTRLAVLVPCLLPAAMALIFWVAPTEATMGEVQKILYLHVSVAWCGLAGCLGMGACGAMYLARRRTAWDHVAQASAEIGWLCSTLTLVTGSLWAHEAWGVWWTWEPRLTSSFVLWLIYAGIFLVRAGIDDPHRRARTGALLSVMAVCDVPLVVVATRWFRGVHPVTPDMDPRMRAVLLATVAGFTGFFVMLTLLRCRQLRAADRVAELEADLDVDYGFSGERV